MDLLIARIIDGLNNGVIYAFLALALVCVYRSTKHLNLAQGEMAMFSAFLAFAFTQAGVPVVFAILLAVAAGAIGGGLIERVLVRPLGNNADYSILLVGIGVFLALNAGAGLIWGEASRCPSPACCHLVPTTTSRSSAVDCDTSSC